MGNKASGTKSGARAQLAPILAAFRGLDLSGVFRHLLFRTARFEHEDVLFGDQDGDRVEVGLFAAVVAEAQSHAGDARLGLHVLTLEESIPSAPAHLVFDGPGPERELATRAVLELAHGHDHTVGGHGSVGVAVLLLVFQSHEARGRLGLEGGATRRERAGEQYRQKNLEAHWGS